MEALNTQDNDHLRVERFKLRGMHCANCATTIENAVAPVPGVVEAHVNFAAETRTARVNDKLLAGEIDSKRTAPGYSASSEPDTIVAARSDRYRHGGRR